MIKKEPLLTHDRNLYIGQIFAVVTIVFIIIESVFTYFSATDSIAMKLGAFAINFLTIIFYLFTLFILRYYMLNFGMHKLRIATMTLIVLLIIQFIYTKLVMVSNIFIGHISIHALTEWITVNNYIQAVLVGIILITYVVAGVMLIGNRTDFVGGLRILGVIFILTVISVVAATWGRNYMIDQYLANQETGEGLLGLLDTMSNQHIIQHILNVGSIAENIPIILIELTLIYILAKAKKHTITWQDPL